MDKNFTIEGNNELVSSDFCMDVHNCFHLAGVDPSVDRRMSLRFVPDKVYGKNKSAFNILFEEVRVFEMLVVEDTVLTGVEEVGYKMPEDFDYDWILREEQAGKECHLVFRFVGDGHIRVYAGRATLRVEHA